MNSADACATVLLFPNLNGLNPTTFIPCDTALYTASIYRATTYLSTASVIPAATSNLPSKTASATSSSLQTPSTESSTSNNGKTSSNSNNKSKDIGFGVGLGVDLPAILLAIAALWFFRRNRHNKDSATALDPNRSNQLSGQPEKQVVWNELPENQVAPSAPSDIRNVNVHEVDNNPRVGHEIDSNPRAELIG
jgi:hypothetical protein